MFEARSCRASIGRTHETAAVAGASHDVASGDALADWVAPGRTAVVVIDIQVDFASPDGVLGKVGLDRAVVAPAVAAAERLVALARAAGTPVVFVGLQTSACALDPPAWRERSRRRGAAREEETAGSRRAGQRAARDLRGPGCRRRANW